MSSISIVSRNIDTALVFFIHYTLVKFKPYCILVNVRTTLKRLHNPNRTSLTQRQQPKPPAWTKTRLSYVSYSDESCFPLLAFRWTCSKRTFIVLSVSIIEYDLRIKPIYQYKTYYS
jgi:hypothetical protein